MTKTENDLIKLVSQSYYCDYVSKEMKTIGVFSDVDSMKGANKSKFLKQLKSEHGYKIQIVIR